MNHVDLRIYGELNRLLWNHREGGEIIIHIKGTPSVKDVVESLGIPHSEVGLLLIDGEVEGFSRKLYGGERVSVYPVFKKIDVNSISKTVIEFPEVHRFVLDVHLGKLARYLRMLGFDVVYRIDADDPWLANISESEKRILLSFDRELLMRKNVSYPYLVRSRYPMEQLKEVIEKFNLLENIKPFSRCLVCNGVLVPINKEKIEDQLPEGVREIRHVFKICENCGKIYWKGTHTDKMDVIINGLRQGNRNENM
ncbi:Mut7-C RNAse domain-containing protein [Gudongella sp. DL1XJH-153]|uniref:Mut7-C RNAse domain-containing protein n=1 Tax=Gudongella sp. DL1XJH-153 TaxID=3409804 RepID=UPI003BB7AC11